MPQNNIGFVLLGLKSMMLRKIMEAKNALVHVMDMLADWEYNDVES